MSFDLFGDDRPRRKKGGGFDEIGIPSLGDMGDMGNLFGNGDTNRKKKIFKNSKGQSFVEDPENPGKLVRLKRGQIVRRGRPRSKGGENDFFAFTNPNDQFNIFSMGGPQKDDPFSLGSMSFGPSGFGSSRRTINRESVPRKHKPTYNKDGTLRKQSFDKIRKEQGIRLQDIAKPNEEADIVSLNPNNSDLDNIRVKRQPREKTNLDHTIQFSKKVGGGFKKLSKKLRRQEDESKTRFAVVGLDPNTNEAKLRKTAFSSEEADAIKGEFESQGLRGIISRR